MKNLEFSLEAHSNHKNIHRFYNVWSEKTSKDKFIIYVHFGRIKTKGRTRVYAATSEEEKLKIINRIRKKRESAISRIGCPYVPVQYN